jgi:DNA polymerase
MPMDIITIDFETYYDKDYTLSKMTTEAYIRDPRFEIIGVGVKVNNYPADWYSGNNPGKFLKSLDYSNKAILCHNTVFDGAILSWHFGIRPRLWLDTLSMARPLHSMTVGVSLAKLAMHYGLGGKGDEVIAAMGKRRIDFTEAELARYGLYCINDVELTKRLFDKLKVGFPVTELLVIDQTIRMYTEPTIELDVPLLEKYLEEVRARKRTLMAELARSMGGEEAAQEMLMSNEKFASHLKSLGVEPPTKISPRTGKETWAFAKTDKGMTDLLEHPDERVQAAVAARLGVKSTLEETRTEALLDVAKRGRLPIMLNYYGAHTGRFSGGDKLNLQNLPSRGDTTIKRALKAPPGNVLIAADSSQIEARLVAYIAGQDDLVEAFRDKRDVYSEFATEIYGRKITKADKVERYVGKVCILGLGYGMGAAKLQRTLEIGQSGISVKIDLAEAERIVHIYRTKNFRIAQFWQKCANALSAMTQGRSGNLHDILPYDSMGITLPSGFKIQYPALRSTPNGFMYVNDPRAYQKAMSEGKSIEDIEESAWTKIYGGKVTENCLAKGTLVLTTDGWKPIEQVARTDLVHDGVEFVQHSGVVFKSVRPCIELNGVFMTPDHKVLTDDGWEKASQVQKPYQPSTTLISKPVYDILNCGLRHRFVVKGATGPMIVHNCVQALATLIIREQMVAIGQYYRVVFQVHDEIIITAPEADAAKAEAKLVEIMSTPPKWAPGLPVICEAGVASNYGDT